MEPRRSDRVLVAIGVFKLAKAIALVTVGIVLIQLGRSDDAAATLERWAHVVHLDPGGRFVREGIQSITGLEAYERELIGCVMFAYAALFLVEGIGLITRRHWAEWLTTIATASLIPFELYEIAREVHVARVLVLVANVAIVIYLIRRLRREHEDKHALDASPLREEAPHSAER